MKRLFIPDVRVIAFILSIFLGIPNCIFMCRSLNQQTIEQMIEDDDDYEVCIAVFVVISWCGVTNQPIPIKNS